MPDQDLAGPVFSKLLLEQIRHPAREKSRSEYLAFFKTLREVYHIRFGMFHDFRYQHLNPLLCPAQINCSGGIFSLCSLSLIMALILPVTDNR